jgi:hypothetical protein
MNYPAAIIAAGLGTAFFAAELAFYFQPSWINSDYIMGVVFSSSHSKARVAVQRLLVDPPSAEFGELRTVEAEKAKFVCGAVKAKDRAGYYAAYREFVYTVANDSARIDDDGWIAQKHAAFRACPVAPEEKPAQQKAPSDAISMVKAIEKAVPAAANSALSTIASNMPAGAGSSPGGSLEQQVGRMANQMTGGPVPGGPSGSPGRSGPAANSGSAGGPQTFMASLGNESEWRSDRPPAAWPSFPFGHPLTKWAPKRTPGLALALAKDIEDRWQQSKNDNTNARPSTDEIQEACRALLTVDPNDSEFPKAWAAFVRLRKI